MKFACSGNKEYITNLEGALFNPIPIEETLWLPNTYHELSYDFFNNIHKMTFHEIALTISKQLIGTEIPENILKNIIEECFDFEIPLKKLNNKLYILELFHGPTLTFKDVGARFMSRILRYFIHKDKEVSIIVSTSGDTGSAVASAFHKLSNVNVHILYPKNMISQVQEKQIRSYGDNVYTYQVEGTFDDCQKLVKDTLNDENLRNMITFFPANSINIARLIPQTFYYFWMYAQLKKTNKQFKQIYISIPSGNLGNLTGGIIAYKLGLPIKHYIAATNANDSFGQYLYFDNIKNKKAVPTISNAMDVSIPNNLIRLKAIFKDNVDMQSKISSISINDKETKENITSVYNLYKYPMDPHTSVGYTALQKYISTKDIKSYTGIILSTAHPSKFPEVMDKLEIEYDIPSQLENLEYRSDRIYLKNNYSDWKNYLIKNSRKNITLIGMPGVGKSHIGKELSKITNWSYLDVDRIMEYEKGKKLHMILEEMGNNDFKEYEQNCTLALKGKNTIFSPGGSVIYSEKAMNHLKNISLIIFLDNSFEVIKKRLGDYSKRGIVLKINQTLEHLYYERTCLCNKYHHIKIDCRKKQANKICEEIMKYI